MATTKIRRTKEDLLKEAEERVKKIKAEIREAGKKKAAKLTKDSVGIAEVITAIEKAAKENKTTLADVIKSVSSLKRTGLVIEKGTRKQKSK